MCTVAYVQGSPVLFNKLRNFYVPRIAPLVHGTTVNETIQTMESYTLTIVIVHSQILITSGTRQPVY